MGIPASWDLGHTDRTMNGFGIGIGAGYMRSEQSFRHAGISRYSLNLLDALFTNHPDHRYEVFVNTNFEAPERWRSIPAVHIRPEVPDKTGGRALFEHFVGARRAARAGAKVWFSTSHLCPFSRRIPRVPTVHDIIAIKFPELFPPKMARYMRFALAYACRKADAVLVNSEATKADIVATFGVDPLRIQVVPHAAGNRLARVPASEVGDDALRALGIPFTRYLLAIGTVEPRKNLPRLFEAMAQLQRDGMHGDVGLVVGGGKGWKDSPIYDRLAELEIGDRVHFLGYVDDADLPKLYARCEAFVFPSLYEGFGAPLVEAMICGAPIVASRQAALTEVAADAGVYFDPLDPADIAQVVAGVLNDRSGRESRVAEGLRRAEFYTWPRVAKQTLEVLADVVRQRRPSR